MLATIESMDVEIANWLGLIFRFVHVVAAIMWIGNSLLFTWMEINLLTPNPEKDGQDPNLLGKLDMLHGGGVFHMEKRLINHTSIPVPLHWFMWQSYTTWITGSLLLATMFYLNGGSSFVDVTKSEISGSTAITLSVLGIVGWWLIYDLIWRSKLKELPRIAIPLTMGLLILAAMGFDQVFNGRALYLQIGVMMGSSMTANVFFHIIRNQKQFMKSLLAGESHDLEYGKQAKTRSMHNHYMTFPVLFMMLSAHFPQLTSPTNRVAILAVIMVMLMGIKFLMNSRNHFKKWHLSIASLTLIGCVFISFVSVLKSSS